MNDLLVVQIRQDVGELREDGQRRGLVERACRFQALLQIRAVHQLHDENGNSILPAEIQHSGEMVMAETMRNLVFLFEAFAGKGILGNGARHDLDGNHLPRFHVAALVHLALGALANFFLQGINAAEETRNLRGLSAMAYSDGFDG